MSAGGVLLDTFAIIWLAISAPIEDVALAAIIKAGLGDGVFVSPISAWEIGLLSRSKAGRGIAFLPEPLHSHPADRLIIATARHLGVPIVTRDSRIIAYGVAGHTSVVVC